MRVTCAQMDMALARPDDNFARAARLIEAAAAERPDVIVLPETWNTGFFPRRLLPELSDRDCARVIGVIADRATRMARIMARDGLTAEAAAARIDNQPDSDFYRARCDFIIENNGSTGEVAAAAQALWEKLLQISK